VSTTSLITAHPCRDHRRTGVSSVGWRHVRRGRGPGDGGRHADRSCRWRRWWVLSCL